MTPTTPSSTASGGQRTGMRTAGGVSDPAIDEHFKRSLGPKKYAAVFNATTTDKETGLSGKYRRILSICPVRDKVDTTFWIQHGPALGDDSFHSPGWTGSGSSLVLTLALAWSGLKRSLRSWRSFRESARRYLDEASGNQSKQGFYLTTGQTRQKSCHPTRRHPRRRLTTVVTHLGEIVPVSLNIH